MNLRVLVTSVAAVAGLCLGWSQATNYSIQSTAINVGTLVQSNGLQGFITGFHTSAPYVWTAMNSDALVKPPEWTLVNPTGPSSINATPTTKATPGYWEVSLDTLTPAIASQYNVLLFPVSGTIDINPTEREALRSFVDGGGVLWVDILGSATVEPGQGLMQDFGLTSSSLTGVVSADFTAPLLATPNAFTSSEVADLSSQGATYRQAITTATGLVSGINDTAGYGFASYRPIVVDAAGQPVVAQASIGAGMVVVTGQGVSANLNNSASVTSLPWTVRTALARRALVSSKFICNLIDLSSGFTRPGGNSRGSGASRPEATAPMVRSFIQRGAYSVVAGPPQSPAAANGKVVVREGTDLVCYQADPRVNSDPSAVVNGSVQLWRVTGVGDFSSPLLTDVPSTSLVDSTGAKATSQVWVAIAGGNAAVYSLTNGQLLATISGLPLLNGGGALTPVRMESVVYFVGDDGSGDHAVLTAVDADSATIIKTAGATWTLTPGPNFAPAPSAPPVVAYIQTAPGATSYDKVLYFATKPYTGLGGPATNCGLVSMWIGAKGDFPDSASYSPGGGSPTVTLSLRPIRQGIPVVTDGGVYTPSARSIKVTAVDYLGRPLVNQASYLAGTSQPSSGLVVVSLTASAAASGYDWDGSGTDPTLKITWRVDYDVDWGQPNLNPTLQPQVYVRGNLFLPDRGDHLATVLGSPVVGPNGNIALVTTRPTGSGGTYYNLLESSMGMFQVRSRWDMHDAIAAGTINGYPTLIAYPGAVEDYDDLSTTILPNFGLANGEITEQKFCAPPTIKGNTVYVMAQGLKNIAPTGPPINVPVGMMLAFNATPDTVQFNADNLPPIGEENLLTINQMDEARSTDPVNPTVPSSISGSNVVMDRASTSTGSSNGRILIDNLAGPIGGVSGSIDQIISCNLPLFVQRIGFATEEAIQPEASTNWTWPGQLSVTYAPGSASGKFDPLRYYQVFFGYTPEGQPVATGSTLFMSGKSFLPDVLNGNTTSPTAVGLLSAQQTNITGTDPFITVNQLKNWQLQLMSVQAGSGNYAAGDWSTLAPNPDILWPYYKGITSLNDLRLRVNQAALDDTDVVNIGADEDTLFVLGVGSVGSAAGTGGLYAYNRLNLLVADSARVGRFDATGNPRWVLQGTKSYLASTQTSDSSTTTTLSDPQRIYPNGTTAQWIVDPGINAVIEVDNAGTELRHISKFKIHPQSVRTILDGVKADEPLNLKGPRDIVTYVDTHVASDVAATFPGETITNTLGAMSERWEHVVIADSGNNRIIELIDRYLLNADGTVYAPVRYSVVAGSPDDEGDGSTTGLGVLLWHTPEELSGVGYSYNSIDRLRVTTGTPRNVYAFGFDNVRPGGTTFSVDSTFKDFDNANGSGGIVVLDGSTTKIIKQIVVPAYSKNTFLKTNGVGGYDFNYPPVDFAGGTITLAGLRSVSTRYVLDSTGSTVLSVMISMAKGVYEVFETSPGVWTVRWMLPNEAYVGMRHPTTAAPYSSTDLASNPTALNAVYATRMPSGDVLIVNGYVGTKYGGASTGGEVMLVDGLFFSGDTTAPGFDVTRPNFGFNSLSVKFVLPPVSGARDIYHPVFAVRQ